MKLSEFKNSIFNRFWILQANTIYTFQQETAHFANNYGNLLSTGLFTFAIITFIHVIYANVKTFAGYDRNEMFFFFFIGQVAFFVNATVNGNLVELIDDVKLGNLDLVLTKPLPALFYVTFKRIRIVSMLRDGFIPIIGPALMVNWSMIHISTSSLVAGILILFFGEIILYTLQFLAAVLVFWLGESLSIYRFVNDMDHIPGRTIPLEGFSFNWKIVFGSVFPVLVLTGFSTSVLLGKSEPWILVIWAGLVVLLALTVRHFVWLQALRNYTSASS